MHPCLIPSRDVKFIEVLLFVSGKKKHLISFNFKTHEHKIIQRKIKRHADMQSDNLNKTSANAGICETLLESNSV
jgi:hypothetical protein